MGGRVKTGIELRIFCSDTMLNYRLSQKFKLLGNSEFNHLTISLTCMRRPECLDGIRSWRKEANGDKKNFDRSNKALLGLHAWVYKETYCAPRLTLIKRILTRKGSRKICVLWESSLQRNALSAKKRMLTLRYYKNPKALTNQGTHNLPQLWHSRVVKAF